MEGFCTECNMECYGEKIMVNYAIEMHRIRTNHTIACRTMPKKDSEFWQRLWKQSRGG